MLQLATAVEGGHDTSFEPFWQQIHTRTACTLDNCLIDSAVSISRFWVLAKN
jgi:hypothetical protein